MPDSAQLLDPISAISALRQAIPYLRPYQGKVFVVKAGGEVFEDPEIMEPILEQVGILHQLGIRVVLVHGGGVQATDLAKRLGIEVNIVEGRRVTCEKTVEVTAMVLNGIINTRIVAACRKFGIPAVGLSGVDADLIHARQRPPVTTSEGKTISYGFVGDIQETHVGPITSLLEMPAVPVVSPLSADDTGTILNINADSVASRLAVDLKAEKLILLTKPRGILEKVEDESSLVSYTDLEGLTDLKERGIVKEGMLPKTAAIRDALNAGVPRVHVISYLLANSLLAEVFTNEGSGTLIVKDRRQLSQEETKKK